MALFRRRIRSAPQAADYIFSERLRRIFDESASLVSRRTAWTLVASIALIIGIYVLSAARWKLDQLSSVLTSIEGIQFLLNVLLGVAVAVLAAMAYAHLQNQEARRRFDLIRSLARADLLHSLFSDLHHHAGRFLSEYNVRVELLRSKLPGVIICQIRYSYLTANKPALPLRFRFSRIRNEGEAQSVERDVDSVATPDLYLTYEFQYTLDERTLQTLAQPEDLTGLYRVRDLSVDGVSTKLERIADGATVEYQAPIPDGDSLERSIALSYTVEFPMEMDSFISVVLELPTLNFACSIDYRDLKEDITLYAEDFLTTRKAVVPHSGDGEINFIHRHWMFPRSGISVIWFRGTADTR